MNKSIRIISSYSDSCGNAYFTKVLENGLSDIGIDTQCAELNLDLTQSIDSAIRKKADAHIKQLCLDISRVNGVNIQVETGLFGTLPGDVIKRIGWLIAANKNTSITLHSPRIIGNAALQRSAIKSAIKGRIKTALSQWLSYKESLIHIKLNRKIVQLAVTHSTPIIVHTVRAKTHIEMLFGYTNVHVHPLKIVESNIKIDQYKFDKLKDRYGLRVDDKVIGMFGFINEYKGHTLALEAIALLPQEFKLFIFGRVHPQTIKQNEAVNPYLLSLQAKIIKNRLEERVFFIGEQSTEDFIDYAGSVDCVWLPYVELGQDGSGIASICCDVSQHVLASTSFAFDELIKLIPYQSVERFDIGNALELATKTKFIKQPKPLPSSEFTTESQAKLYANLVINFKQHT